VPQAVDQLTLSHFINTLNLTAKALRVPSCLTCKQTLWTVNNSFRGMYFEQLSPSKVAKPCRICFLFGRRPVRIFIVSSAVIAHDILWHLRHVYVLGLGYFVWPWSPHRHRTSPHRHRTFRDVTPGPLTVTDTCIMYHLTNFKASWNVILHMRYVSTCVWARVVGVGKQWTKAIRCGACYYSIVVNAHRVTSMADTDIDAVRKQKKAEYAKQYRLKRKLLLQQQASKDIYMIGYFHP
jgi:hypothetical protein